MRKNVQKRIRTFYAPKGVQIYSLVRPIQLRRLHSKAVIHLSKIDVSIEDTTNEPDRNCTYVSRLQRAFKLSQLLSSQHVPDFQL